MKTYILKPTMTPATLNRTAILDKPVVLPPRQPLPRPSAPRVERPRQKNFN